MEYRKLVLLSRTSTKNFTYANICIVGSAKHSMFLGRIVLLLALGGVGSWTAYAMLFITYKARSKLLFNWASSLSALASSPSCRRYDCNTESNKYWFSRPGGLHSDDRSVLCPCLVFVKHIVTLNPTNTDLVALGASTRTIGLYCAPVLSLWSIFKYVHFWED